jgi:hypothetical protein
MGKGRRNSETNSIAIISMTLYLFDAKTFMLSRVHRKSQVCLLVCPGIKGGVHITQERYYASCSGHLFRKLISCSATQRTSKKHQESSKSLSLNDLIKVGFCIASSCSSLMDGDAS